MNRPRIKSNSKSNGSGFPDILWTIPGSVWIGGYYASTIVISAPNIDSAVTIGSETYRQHLEDQIEGGGYIAALHRLDRPTMLKGEDTPEQIAEEIDFRTAEFTKELIRKIKPVNTNAIIFKSE